MIRGEDLEMLKSRIKISTLCEEAGVKTNTIYLAVHRGQKELSMSDSNKLSETLDFWADEFKRLAVGFRAEKRRP